MATYVYNQGFCKHCNKYVETKRKGTSHVLHLILTIISLGTWLIIWLLCFIKIGGWRCTACGSLTISTLRKRIFG